ncbi:YicC/YloC family endoribonuclease [Marinicella sp. W31]|uniref:YicC/YloC family endoribonuclease n=1 Tax=Marinicella sp. W31 TaxID=3023713 RepID=UPI00375690BD
MHSMTAFAYHETDTPLGVISCEIKSVNQRFLDLTIKAPEFVRQEEEKIRKLFAQDISRGKVSVFVRFYPKSEVVLNQLTVNHSVVQQLQACAEEIQTAVGLDRNDMSVARYMHWSDVIVQSPTDTSSLSKYGMDTIKAAIADLQASRAREGQAMHDVLSSRVETIHKMTAEIREYVPQINQYLQDKLRKKLDEMDVEVNPERFEQELAFQLQRIDISEELDRLDAHVEEVSRVLSLEEPVGRRLDFLVQELNREANTIGSKSASVMTTNASVELKVAIEQMREQIQNIE